MNDITIRPCRLDETDVVLDIWKRAGSKPSASDTPEALQSFLAEQPGMLLLAISGGNIIGTVMGGWDGWRGNIYRLAVLPEYRERGVARTLVRVIEGLLFELGAEKISALVEKDGPEGISFWEAMADSDYGPDNRFLRFTKKRA
jgi:ribosomal protein S18 acetylase RimI-like enzyme